MNKAFSLAVSLTLVTLPIAASAQGSTPVAVVKSAYTCVLSSSCPQSKARTYLTPSFAKELATVDALGKTCKCEVIDASPWLDVQAEPGAFSLGNAKIDGSTALVPIHFSGGKSGAFSLTVKTKRTASGWAISDILTRNGQSTAAMLATNIANTQKWLTSPDRVLRGFQLWHARATRNGTLMSSFASGKSFLTPAFAREVQPKLSQSVDPFTLSTAHVVEWEFSKAKVNGAESTALARLQFKDGTNTQVVYHLKRIANHWAISDISLP